LSVQVLQEFYVNATGKLAQTLPEAETMEFIRWLERFPMVPTDVALFGEAVRIRKQYQVSYWDATILAAAMRLSAAIVYTEDLSHGQAYGSVRVENPFWDLETQATPPAG
jgi:predicted nucleic acid-binding protein